MTNNNISSSEREAIQKYWEKPLADLHPEEFKNTHKRLRAKYHPDNFAKFEDETVLEMAKERFQLIESLARKLNALFKDQLPTDKIKHDDFQSAAQFAFDKMKIEVISREKELKYHLFGKRYRWLVYGDTFKIPNTKGAYLVIDDDHRGRSIGFRETIRMYITFDVADSVEDIVDWLFLKIQNGADSLIIEGESIPVDRNEMIRKIRKTSYLELGSG
ncbi:MAG TPA: hypothetical protein VJ953_11545 [Saprospiraceae bacterium]|nr:hypothetical protein [Saprospiraceae bacterium]